MTYKYQRPLVLKSPGHTCRIGLLLDLFPEAKFVLIHRDPYDVYQSTVHTVRKAGPFWAFQGSSVNTSRIVDDYVEISEAYFAQRHLIRQASLCEISFEQLENQPIDELRRVYESLDLPDFHYAEPKFRDYLQSIAGYQKNVHPDLPPETRELLAQRWGRCFDEWGYEKSLP